MQLIRDVEGFNFEHVPTDSFWNTGNEAELKIHRIHAYPAKFPAFITTKALEYAKSEDINVRSMADIFCGCGTTAFEAKRNSINFWGCDINPIATLIAKVKSQIYNEDKLDFYFSKITDVYKNSSVDDCYETANERLKYWYDPTNYHDLVKLKNSISCSVSRRSIYKDFFDCAFSNILKATSKWLTKSIKPQIDPLKKPADVFLSFKKQYKMMQLANHEVIKEGYGSGESEIITASFLSDNYKKPMVDMIITSPPYVTSYEYADLHQLSTLWLDVTDDFRSLREGTIGSLHHDYNFTREWKRLNNTGLKIVSLLLDSHKSKAKTVAKYFLDMQFVAKKSFNMINKGGLAFFVIGNTEYKGVRIDNAKHLTESLYAEGFNEVFTTKRKISNKILTPYRDAVGKFSTDSSGRKVYSEEFILIGKK